MIAMDTEPIGLIAGWGRFPILFAQKAHSLGTPVVCIGVHGLARREDFEPYVKQYVNVRLGALDKPIRAFRKAGVRRYTMAGKLHETVLFSPYRMITMLPDLRMLRWWFFRRKRDYRDDTIILGFIEEYQKEGLKCESALDTCPELLVKPGVLTRRQPSKAEDEDIRFGWEVAKEMGRMDIGQSVMVQDHTVLAVEAIEGTDQAILRAGKLSRRGGFTMVKVAKPHQDMRFDVPTVGVKTIETIRQAGGRVLAIEAGKTIILDEAETIATANRHGIVIKAV